MIKSDKKKRNKKKNSKNDNKLIFNLYEMIVIVIISILFGGVVGGLVFSTKVDNSKVDNELKELHSTYNDIIDNYYKDIDKKELINAAIEGMVNYLGDPYSSYMDSEETDDFNTTVSGKYEGIGVTITMNNDYPMVIAVFENSPAQKAGLEVKDVIIEVNGKSTKSQKLTDIVGMIKKKNAVKIKVLRGEEEKTFDLKLSNVTIPSVSNKIYEENGKKVGYINISLFSATTYDQFEKKLKELEKDNIDSLIIDVRDNPGGHLGQVSRILSLFMDKKSVLYQIKSGNKTTKAYSYTNEKRTYPIAVLINENSASASEILAGAIKESYGGEIVGTKSYGKGTVQKEYSLSTGSSIKYTTEEWLTPNGNNINGEGIEPTVKVEASDEYLNNPKEENDNQLDAAINKLTK